MRATALRVFVVGWAAHLGCSPASGGAPKDLVPVAERSMRRFMVLNPQPMPDHPDLYLMRYDCYGVPPRLGHNQWGFGDATGRAVRSWLFVREMTGEKSFGRQVEQGQRKLLLWLLTPEDGLACVPNLSDRAKGRYYYHMWDQGRTLRALVAWWLAETDREARAALKGRVHKMIDGLDKIASHRADPEHGECVTFAGGVCDKGVWAGTFSPRPAGQLLEPLAVFWDATGDEKAGRLADAICNGVLAGDMFGPDGAFTGHFHNKSSILVGIARYGAALCKRGDTAKGVALLETAKRSYDWTLSPGNPNVAGSWGWFPENTGGNTRARTICEICCTADMIELAAVLAAAAPLDPKLGACDALWDHVERYTVNNLVDSQFTITPAYRELIGRVGGDLDLAGQLVGAWSGYHQPHDLITFRRSDGRLEMLMGCCCNYSGTRGLYACWKEIVRDDGRTLSVRLPLSRRSKTLSQEVTEAAGPGGEKGSGGEKGGEKGSGTFCAKHPPGRSGKRSLTPFSRSVKQTLHLAAPRRLRVRIPDWADLGAVRAVTAEGKPLAFSFQGRWMELGDLRAQTKLVVTYPLVARTTVERVGGKSWAEDFAPADDKRRCTVHWLGNRVVGFQPEGEILPIYPAAGGTRKEPR